MPKIAANGLTMYYEMHGDPDKPIVILIAGLSRDHTIWEMVLGEFASDFRVIIYDNRGAGQTDKPKGPYLAKMMGEDLAALMDALEVPSAHIVGHSMGGFIAQYLAAKHPKKVNKLVLCSTCIKQSEMSISYLEQNLEFVRTGQPVHEMIKAALPLLFAPDFLTETIEEKIIEGIESNPYPPTPESLEAQIIACIEQDSSKFVSTIKAPTLVLTGSEDLLMPPEVSQQLAAKIPGAKHVVIDGPAHMVQIEDPKEFCRVVIDFLSK
jgi:3-oxoadipate enol-lactonase